MKLYQIFSISYTYKNKLTELLTHTRAHEYQAFVDLHSKDNGSMINHMTASFVKRPTSIYILDW